MIIRKIKGGKIVIHCLGASDEFEGSVFFEKNFSGTKLAVIIISHRIAVGSGIVDINKIVGKNLGKHTVDRKLVIILALAAGNVILIGTGLVLFS